MTDKGSRFGPGLAPEHAARVFQTNFSTKEEGMGLGLAIVASVATIHGGSAAAHPRSGGGLTISVTIPSAETAPADPVLFAGDQDEPGTDQLDR